METRIGYVEGIGEDLLEAAWRESMAIAGPRARAPRRRPSWQVVVAAVSVATLVAAGGVGWYVTRPGGVIRARALQSEHRAALRAPSASPAPADQAKSMAGFGLNQSQIASGGELGAPQQSIALPVDLSKVVKTADLSVVVGGGKFEDRFGQLTQIAGRLHGYVQTSTTRGSRSGSLTMRVPASRFDAAVHAIAGLGRIERQTISGKDVTAQYIDLSSRLRIAKARRRVLMKLMQKATSIAQTIQVQNTLDDTQLRIEDLQGSLNVLNDQTSLGTISVDMREAGVPEHATTNVRNASITGAIDRAVAGFFAVVAGVIVGLGYVIPALVVLVLLWFAVMRLRRRLA